jgi:hypothetical protein
LPLVRAMKEGAGQPMWARMVLDLNAEDKAVADSF